MQHYFVNKREDDMFYFASEDLHHLVNVMRIRNNEKVICCFEGEFYLTEVLVNNKDLKAHILEKLLINNELKCKINLIYGLPKGEKLDLVIQKAVELGVNKITLLNAKRSIVKFEDKKLKAKEERFNKIIKEAAMQSKRNIIPSLIMPISLKEVPLNDINLIAYEEESKNNQETLFNILNSDLEGKEINIVVGPEGGFEESEVNYLKEKGYNVISLGKRILRSETACIDLMSIIQFMAERN